MLHACKNNRNLLFSKIDEIEKNLGENDITPCVVLIGGNIVNKNYIDKEFNDTILMLIDKGCSFFVCHGEDANKLEDAIDYVIEDAIDYVIEDNEGLVNSQLFDTVITTAHQDESFDETVDFFVNSTNIWNKDNGGLMVILGNNSDIENRRIESLILEQSV